MQICEQPEMRRNVTNTVSMQITAARASLADAIACEPPSSTQFNECRN